MQKKSRGSQTGTTTVTSAEVKTVLTRDTTGLAADEEKALRMLHGVGGSHSLVLERVGQNNLDTRDALLSMEVELLRQLRARSATSAPQKQTLSRTDVAPNPRRDEIVKALKAKKPSR